MNEQGRTIAIVFIVLCIIGILTTIYDQMNEPEDVIIERIRYGTIREMQEFAGVVPDGVWGPETDREYRRAQSEYQFGIELENIKQLDREFSQNEKQ